ncbi:transport and Golgi organization protein 11-like isoform X3 [Eriocheir sinensis]|uniref:transport and Golgi organization protein 11-like isoform X3 n=1 Tax=Eriocheir sinensis TaxID=95602 RepID=UPI0021C6FC9A|nr:transport and Golgi organization protein 11-like isoform X3 [Eriocheir sinensis]
MAKNSTSSSRPHTWDSSGVSFTSSNNSSTTASTSSTQLLSPTDGYDAPTIFYSSGFERMSNITSPQRFSGTGTYDHFYDGHYEPDLSTQMKVPKRIRVTGGEERGDNDDDPTVNWARFNGVNEKFQMNVPDRIVVAGGEQHIGTRGVPREVELEKSIMPQPDPSLYRVQTPPRSITLDTYSYPGTEDLTPSEDRESSTPGSIPTMLPRPSSTTANSYIHPVPEHGGAGGVTTDLSPGEEVSLLRRQVGRLNRRVMALELDTQQRAHREMLMYTLGAAYFLIKALLWLNRN